MVHLSHAWPDLAPTYAAMLDRWLGCDRRREARLAVLEDFELSRLRIDRLDLKTSKNANDKKLLSRVSQTPGWTLRQSGYPGRAASLRHPLNAVHDFEVQSLAFTAIKCAQAHGVSYPILPGHAALDDS